MCAPNGSHSEVPSLPTPNSPALRSPPRGGGLGRSHCLWVLGKPAPICVTLEHFSHSPQRQASHTQPRAGEVPPHGNRSVSYLDRLRARDDDRGFVEDVDPHDRPILLSPGNQSDPEEAVNYRRREYHPPRPSRRNRVSPPRRGLTVGLGPRLCPGADSLLSHSSQWVSVSTSMKRGCYTPPLPQRLYWESSISGL